MAEGEAQRARRSFRGALVSAIQLAHNVRQHGAVLATGRAEGHNLAWLEELVIDDGRVHLVLQRLVEAILAQLHGTSR